MSKIIHLDKALANQIAAWEVVERPISIVKELVENSIDAWATYIKVEIKEGWKKEIVVTDNWEGIEKEDMQIGRAHVWTPVKQWSSMPSSAWKKNAGPGYRG